jgi:hypothetical protein
MPQRNAFKTERLQLSLDPQNYRLLTEKGSVGLYGTSEGEVGTIFCALGFWRTVMNLHNWGFD